MEKPSFRENPIHMHRQGNLVTLLVLDEILYSNFFRNRNDRGNYRLDSFPFKLFRIRI